jgi:hypothetical protein
MRGHRAILLVGDPEYYERFGFTADKTALLWMPGAYDRRRLLALELVPGSLDWWLARLGRRLDDRRDRMERYEAYYAGRQSRAFVSDTFRAAFGDRFRADVEGDIEDVDGVLRITRIRVRYTLKAPAGKTADAREAMGTYIVRGPAAMSVRGCIAIEDTLDVSELET